MSDIHNTNNRIGQQNVNSTVYNQYLGREVRRFLNTPPHYPDVFLGRDDDLPKIKELLFSANENILLLVNGEGGIGKTTVAARYFHTYWRDYRHLAWVFVEEGLVKSLLNLELVLGSKHPNLTATELERLNYLLTFIANLDRPCLMVLDNANHLADLKKHYPLLRTCTNLHLLLTSRITKFAPARLFPIQQLEQQEAIDLFRTHYPLLKTEEEDLLTDIFEAVGYNTLVIEILAKNLNNFNNELEEQYRLADLLSDLQQKSLLTLTHSDQIDTHYQAKHRTMRSATPTEIIGAMYDLNRLNATEQQLLTIFSVLPAENLPYTILKQLITNIPNLSSSLLSLAQRGWLDFDEKNKDFKISPVVQEVALQKVENKMELTDGLVQALIHKFDYEPNTGHLLNFVSYSEAGEFSKYAQTVIDTLNFPSPNIGLLCDRVANFYKTTGLLSNALAYFAKYKAIQELLIKAFPDNVSFKNGLAISYSKLGETHSALGQLDKALQFFEERSRLGEELFKAFPDNVSFKNGLAISFWKLGNWHHQNENLNETVAYFKKAEILWEELATAFPNYREFTRNFNFIKNKIVEVST